MDLQDIEYQTGIDFANKFLVLAGAGISMDSPSSCLSGFEIVNFLLETLGPTQDIRDDLRNRACPISFPASHNILRFEHLIAVIQNAIDPSLKFLYDLFDYKKPNYNHRMLAGLIDKGNCVITTNFDMSIEQALAGKSYHYKVAGLDDWIPLDEKDSLGFLGKIHGSLYANHKISPQTIQATIRSIITGSSDQIASSYKPKSSEHFFKTLILSRPLIVFGYSGYDDYDIVRWLTETSSDQAIVWVKHANENHISVETISDVKVRLSKSGRFTDKSDEILYNLVNHGSRQADRVFQIVGHTNKILKVLSQFHSDEHYQNVAKTFPNDFNLADNHKWLAVANIYMQLDEIKEAHHAFTMAASKTAANDPETRYVGYYNASDTAMKLLDYPGALTNIKLAKAEAAIIGTEYRKMLTLFLETRILFLMGKKEDFLTAFNGFREVNKFIINKIQAIENNILTNQKYTSDDITELKRDKELHAVCSYNELKMLSHTNLFNNEFIQKFESIANYCHQLGIFHIEYHAKIDTLQLKKHFQQLNVNEIAEEKEKLIKEIHDFGIPFKDFFIKSILNI